MLNKLTSLLYGTKAGRLVLPTLISPAVSNLAGIILDTKVSRCLIAPFIKSAKINMDEFIDTPYNSFNEFFTRKIKSSARPIDEDPKHLIAPCDGRMTVHPIDDNSVFSIKGTEYTLESLFRSKTLADYYNGGTLLLFRLCVDDYHRYCFMDDGEKSKTHHIKGFYHTVNPLANEHYEIYKENTREFCMLKSKNFGNLLIMEVGAMLVGRITNYAAKKYVKRGEEKGRFEYGGSTIIVCLKKDAATIDENILLNSQNNIETIVKMGAKIGTK